MNNATPLITSELQSDTQQHYGNSPTKTQPIIKFSSSRQKAKLVTSSIRGEFSSMNPPFDQQHDVLF
jgi:hypothetical protein